MGRCLLVAVVAIGAGCGHSPSTRHSDDAPPQLKPAADAGPGTSMKTTTFRVASRDDLQLPLAKAIADAEKSGAEELRVVFAPGRYEGNLALKPFTADDALRFTVEPEGDAPVVLVGGLSIEGRSVAVHRIVVDGARAPGTVVRLRAFESVDVDRLSVVGSRAGDVNSKEGDPLIELVARKRGATATLRDLWVVDSQANGAALVDLPINGAGRWSQVTLSNVVFTGNQADNGFDIGAADAVLVDGALVAEPKLAASWMFLRTFAKVTVRDALVAVRKGLVDFATSEDTKADDFPKLALDHVDLRGPGKTERVDATAVTWGTAPPASLDTTFATAPARTDAAPDRAALITHLAN